MYEMATVAGGGEVRGRGLRIEIAPTIIVVVIVVVVIVIVIVTVMIVMIVMIMFMIMIIIIIIIADDRTEVACARTRFRVRRDPGFSPVSTVVARGECVPVVLPPRRPIGDSH